MHRAHRIGRFAADGRRRHVPGAVHGRKPTLEIRGWKLTFEVCGRK